MKRGHIILVAIGLVLAAALAITLVVTRGAGSSELKIIQRLLEASKNNDEVIDDHKVRQAVARGRARRICAEAVELWAAYAHRCSRQDAADRERLREAVREAAARTLGCQQIWQVGAGKDIDRCFSFLMTGPCDVLGSEPRELQRSSGKGKPRPHEVCQGIF